MSLHSSVQQLAAQTAEMVRLMLSGGLSAAQYPHDFDVTVNAQVARSLGIDVPAEGFLAERLRRRVSGHAP